jgi:hypothetical protein
MATTNLSQDAAKSILMKRKNVSVDGVYQLQIKTFSEQVFPTTLLDKDGNIVYRRLINWDANNANRRVLVMDSLKAGDYLTALNNVQLVSDILSTSSKFGELYNGAICNVEVQFVDKDEKGSPVLNKAGLPIAKTIARVKLLAIVQPAAPKADANFWGVSDETAEEEQPLSEEQKALIAQMTATQNAAENFAGTPPAVAETAGGIADDFSG